MTAAIGAEAAGAAGAEGAAAGAGARAGSSAAKVAPTGSAPVGTAPSSAGRPGTKARRTRDVAPKRQRSSSGPSSTRTRTTGTTRKGKGGNKFLTLPGSGKGRGGRGSSGARRLLVAEFVLCALIVAFAPMTDTHKSDTPGHQIKRLSAVAALFLLLALLSSGGRSTARVAAAFGGLVTLALMVSDREIFTKVAERLGAVEDFGPAGPTGTGSDGSSSVAPPDEGAPPEATPPGEGLPPLPGTVIR